MTGCFVALDGTEYFNSTQIHCCQCSTRTLRSGEIHYFHSVVTPVIVCLGKTQVIPLAPEFIRPQDGHDKQDCENAAAKRWLSLHGERLRGVRATALGHLLTFMLEGLELEIPPNSS